MKITNAFFEQNVNQDSPLIKLCQCNQLPAKTSYWLSRLLAALEPLNKTYASERRKLIEKWCDKEDGKPKEENGQYKLSEHMEEFSKEYQELLEIELDIDLDTIEIALDSIPMGVLNSYDYARLDGIVTFKE